MGDISALLEFTFWQEALYLSFDESFPNIEENVGCFLRISENTRNALTFYVLTKEEMIIFKSVVRQYDSLNDPNFWAEWNEESVMHLLREVLKINETAELDSLNFSGKNYVYISRNPYQSKI